MTLWIALDGSKDLHTLEESFSDSYVLDDFNLDLGIYKHLTDDIYPWMEFP